MVETVDAAPTPEVRGNTYISREAYKQIAQAEGMHRHQIDGSWYYLVNDFVYANAPQMRAAYETYPRYATNFPIALKFDHHPDFEHQWRDDETAEVDGMNLESLAEYLRNASSMAAEQKLPVEKFLNRRCDPGWVEFWQKLAEGYNPAVE